MSVHDDYLASLPPDQQAELSRVRDIITQVAPSADEVIGYGMPVFKYKGKYVIGFSAFKNHMSIFPGPEAIAHVAQQLTDYKTAKGTVQFTAAKPLPKKLIVAIVQYRIKAIESTTK